MRELRIRCPDGARPTSPQKLGDTLLARCRDWPHPDISLELVAVMNFPNEERRQNAVRAAFNLAYGLERKSPPSSTEINWRMAGEDFLDLLDSSSVKAQTSWRNAGNLVVCLASIDATDHPEIKGGASLSKARALLEAESDAPNRHRLAADWKRFKDVAHLAAAASLISSAAIDQVGPHADLNLITPILADPISVLCLAAAIQTFGLAFSSQSRNETLLESETLWRVPSSFRPSSLRGVTLNEIEIQVLVEAAKTHRAKRRRQTHQT